MPGASESAPRNTIVLQPGSSYLRIGLATDPNPHLMRHIIAYKLKAAPPADNVQSVLLTEQVLDVCYFILFVCLYDTILCLILV